MDFCLSTRDRKRKSENLGVNYRNLPVISESAKALPDISEIPIYAKDSDSSSDSEVSIADSGISVSSSITSLSSSFSSSASSSSSEPIKKRAKISSLRF